MQSTKKSSTRYGHLVGQTVILGVLAVSVAGCVAEPYPGGGGYYRAYPDDTYYDYGYPQSSSYYYPNSTVTFDLGGDDDHRRNDGGPVRNDYDWHDRGHDIHDDNDHDDHNSHWR